MGDRYEIEEKLHDVQYEKTYVSYNGTTFSEVLSKFNFESAFGVRALRIGPYTDLEFAQPASGSSLDRSEVKGNSWVSWIIVIISCLIVFTCTFVFVMFGRRRSLNDEEQRMKMLLNQRMGTAFQFSGGEVDPETGESFFAMSPMSPQGGRSSMGKFQQGSALASNDPVSPLHNNEELGADFSNPLYKGAGGHTMVAETAFDNSGENAATVKFLAKYGSNHPLANVAAPRLAGAKTPGDSLRWTTSGMVPSSPPSHFHPGVTRNAEVGGTDNQLFGNHFPDSATTGNDLVDEAAFVESFNHYLSSSENY